MIVVQKSFLNVNISINRCISPGQSFKNIVFQSQIQAILSVAFSSKNHDPVYTSAFHSSLIIPSLFPRGAPRESETEGKGGN